MKPKLHYLLAAILGLFAVLWMTYWSGYRTGYIKVKNEQYSTTYMAAVEKLHFLKMLDGTSKQALKSDIKLSIKGNIAELEFLNSYIQKFDGFHLLDRVYEMPMLAYLASKLANEDQERESRQAALKSALANAQ